MNSISSLFPLTMSELVPTSYSTQETVPMLDVILIEAAKREVYTPACEKPDEVRAKQGG